jgi:hypothetical protein
MEKPVIFYGVNHEAHEEHEESSARFFVLPAYRISCISWFNSVTRRNPPACTDP